MAFVVLSSRSIARAGIKPLSRRHIAIIAITSALAAGLIAFVAGVTLGKYFSDNELVQAASLNARDTAEGRYAVERMGELSGKLVRLEQEASTLAQKISALELFKSKLGGKNAAPAPAPQQPVAGAPAGGPIHAPRSCAVEPPSGDTLSGDIARFSTRMDCLLDAFSSIQRATANRSIAYMMFPTRAPVPNAELGSAFGNRMDPINGHQAFHSGLDFSAPMGTPIRAAGGARVVYAGWRNEMGNMVELDHGSGLVTRYAHASRLLVKTGDVVTPGQVIAHVGMTGRTTGPHLHFEVLREGHYVNPNHYLSLALGESNG